jgi:adenylosuccinate lyase
VIERYSRPEMDRLWSRQATLEGWLEVELAVTEARERRGDVPAGTTAAIRAKARIDPARMAAIEAEVHHDVIAFLSMIAETAGPEARHLHVGMTSSDLVDTALAIQLRKAGLLLMDEVERLEAVCRRRALRHRETLMVGRTHGMHAEPITFGLKCLRWADTVGRDLRRLHAAIEGVSVGKCSGAVGTLAHLDAEIEERALKSLGLGIEPYASQVVQRDRHAALLCAIAILGGTLETIAVEIRHLQRSEVREAAEPFAERQKGSSAMPHKRNPVRCERVSGLARLLRAYAQVGLDDQVLWHERDISHSSAERVILPDAFLAADFAASEVADIVEHLRVDEARMRENLEAGGGLIFSQRVLLALTEAGLARDEAYAVVQAHALAALEKGASFRAGIEADPRVRALLPPDRLAACFDVASLLRGLPSLFSPGRAAKAVL